MKILPIAVCLALTLLILASGCIGANTTDIVVGDKTVGKIYLTPNNDKLLSDSAITDKFDMKVELFGFEFSKEGLTQTEADSIINKISSGVDSSEDITDLGFDIISSAKPDTPDEIINQIVNMPISAKDDTKVWDAINLKNVAAGFEELAQKMMNILGQK